MKKYLILLALFAPIAHASLYKCVKNGAVSYQEAPCDGASTAAQTGVQSGHSMEGCYKRVHPAEPFELFEVRAVSKGVSDPVVRYDAQGEEVVEPGGEQRGLALLRKDHPHWPRLDMHIASAEEQEDAASESKLHLRRGLVTDNNAVGIFEGREAGSYYMQYDGAMAVAHKVACQ